MKDKQKYLYVIGSVVLIGSVFYAGMYTGRSYIPETQKVFALNNKDPQFETSADFNVFWKVWNVLNEKSIYAKNITDQERVYGAAQGLASSLGDTYTVFFTPEENKLFSSEIQGSFDGIGAEIGIKEKILTVIAPLKDSPAMKAGLKKGDKIIQIDKTSTNNMTVDKAITLIRGKKGTEVLLTIFRTGESKSREIKIIRDKVEIPTIDTKIIGTDIFSISLYSFSENSVSLFKNSIKEFKKTGYKKLIIDLRGNPGGYLDAATSIASMFLDEGKIIVTEDFGEKKKPVEYRSSGPRLFDDTLSIIILVDGGSASASEILAGALQQHKTAKLVGETTFGKGSVQELVKIDDKTSLKVTVARWLTPDGSSISLKGLEPDFTVGITPKDYEDKKDPQLEKAIEILSKK